MAQGPYNAGTRVKVADASSQWRGHVGEVLSRDGSTHNVRLDGFAKDATVPLLTPQLRRDLTEEVLDYSH